MEKKKIETFEDLRVWQKGMELVKQVDFTHFLLFPPYKRAGLFHSHLVRQGINSLANIKSRFKPTGELIISPFKRT